MKSWDTEWPDLSTFWYHLLFVSFLTQGPPRHSHGQVSVVPSVKPSWPHCPHGERKSRLLLGTVCTVLKRKKKKEQYGLSNPVLCQLKNYLRACFHYSIIDNHQEIKPCKSPMQRKQGVCNCIQS